MIGGGEDEENTQDEREPGKGFVKGRGNESQHEDEERDECNPVKKFKHEGHDTC